jgi:FixJ family two-component response regulator
VTAAAGKLADQRPVVCVIDDDVSVRDSIEDLLQSVGLNACVFASAQDFLDADRPEAPSCIVLDVRLPGASGLEFQRHLAERGIQLPIVFITGHGDIPMTVRAMKSGAVEFLTKPLREQELLDAVHTAIERDRARRQDVEVVAELQARYASLTPRERDVFALVVTGRPNKLIAAELDLSEMTVKVHRGQIMRKLHAKSVVDLVRIADRLGITTPNSRFPEPKY